MLSRSVLRPLAAAIAVEPCARPSLYATASSALRSSDVAGESSESSRGDGEGGPSHSGRRPEVGEQFWEQWERQEEERRQKWEEYKQARP